MIHPLSPHVRGASKEKTTLLLTAQMYIVSTHMRGNMREFFYVR